MKLFARRLGAFGLNSRRNAVVSRNGDAERAALKTVLHRPTLLVNAPDSEAPTGYRQRLDSMVMEASCTALPPPVEFARCRVANPPFCP
jgi:hypothetical protein